MEPIVKTLDHEFAANAKLSLEEILNDETIKGLKPLPTKVKYDAIVASINEIETTIPECEVTVAEGEIMSTAVINFSKFRKSKEIKINDESGLDKLADIIIMEILRLTQNNIRKILTEMDENFKDYYRSDAFFESSRNVETLTLNWSRAKNVNK